MDPLSYILQLLSAITMGVQLNKTFHAVPTPMATKAISLTCPQGTDPFLQTNSDGTVTLNCFK